MPSATLRELLSSAAPDAWESEALLWPPDAFGLASFLLYISGSYLRVINDWPPDPDHSRWAERMRRLGNAWRKAAVGYSAPDEVRKIWEVVVSNADIPLSDLKAPHAYDSSTNVGKVVEALSEIVAIADEACLGIGIPGDDVRSDEFLKRGALLLYDNQPSGRFANWRMNYFWRRNLTVLRWRDDALLCWVRRVALEQSCQFAF